MHQFREYSSRVVFIGVLIGMGLLVAPGFAAPEHVAISTVDAAEVVAADSTPEVAAPTSAFEAAGWTGVDRGGVHDDVFALALHAAATAVARGDVHAPRTLTIVDFSKPSTARRLWVYDLNARTLLFEELVSHGRNSGGDMATLFSNVPESNKSSIGLFRTAEAYIGKHGYSLRLDGLEKGINDRARERAIVIHGASYVSEGTSRALGRLGRSLGCPAVRPEISRRLIDAVKEGGLVFAYYPDETWLRASPYLS